VGVVPGDELGRRPRSCEILARDAQSPVALGAKGIDDGVVQLRQVGVREVPPDLDVAEEPEARLERDPLERPRHRLELRMIRRDPESHEAPRCRQALDHVHLDRDLGIQQSAGSVEAGRT
jgi:hypothetical protein